jgi:hypothetical protein
MYISVNYVFGCVVLISLLSCWDSAFSLSLSLSLFKVVDEKDRQKVITQITMDLAPKVKNQTAFELPTIYIPEKAKSTHVPNHLDELFVEIDKTIDFNVQNTLDTLEKDCKLISKTIDQ